MDRSESLEKLYTLGVPPIGELYLPLFSSPGHPTVVVHCQLFLGFLVLLTSRQLYTDVFSCTLRCVSVVPPPFLCSSRDGEMLTLVLSLSKVLDLAISDYKTEKPCVHSVSLTTQVCGSHSLSSVKGRLIAIPATV